MKAIAAVMTQLQRQQTLFGLPPFAAAGAVCAGLLAFAVLSYVALWAAFPAALAAFAAVWAWGWRAGRTDPHFDRALALALPWWRGAGERHLIAGRGPERARPARRGRRR